MSSQLDGKIGGFSPEITGLLLNKSKALSKDDLAELESMVLADGKVSEAELDLFAELAQNKGQLELLPLEGGTTQTLTIDFIQDSQVELKESQQRLLNLFSHLTQNKKASPEAIQGLQAEAVRLKQILGNLDPHSPDAILAQKHIANIEKALAIYGSTAPKTGEELSLQKLKNRLAHKGQNLDETKLQQLYQDLQILQGSKGSNTELAELKALLRTVRNLKQYNSLLGELFPTQKGLLRKAEFLNSHSAFLEQSVLLKHLDASHPSPEGEKLLQNYQTLLDGAMHPEKWGVEHLSALTSLALAAPAEAGAFKGLLPSKWHPFLERFQNKGSRLSESTFLKALADPTAESHLKLKQALQNVASPALNPAAFQALGFLLVHFHADLEIVKDLLPENGIKKRLEGLLNQTDWLKTSSTLQGLKDPAALQTVSESFSNLMALSETQEPGPEHAVALLNLYQHLKNDIGHFNAILPAKAQALSQKIITHLDKYQTSNPEQFKALVQALSSLADASFDQQDLSALQTLVGIAKQDVLQLLNDLRSLLPQKIQNRIQVLIDSKLEHAQLKEALSALNTLSNDQLTAQDVEALFKLASLFKTNLPQVLEWLPNPLQQKTKPWVLGIQKMIGKLEAKLTREQLQDTLLNAFEKHPKLIGSAGVGVLGLGAIAGLGYVFAGPISKAWQGEYQAAAVSLAQVVKDNSGYFLSAEGMAVLGATIEAMHLDEKGMVLFQEALEKGAQGSDEGAEALRKLGQNLKEKTASPAVSPIPPQPDKIPAQVPDKAPGHWQTFLSKHPEWSGPLSKFEKEGQVLFEKYPAEQVERLLKLLAQLKPEIAEQVLAHPDELGKILPTLSKIVGVLESKGVETAQKLLPKVAQALTKAVPVFGAYQAAKDAQRLMEIAQTGKYQNEHYGKDARALALAGSGLNQLDALLGVLEATGLGNVDFLPQLLLAGGELGVEIAIELYKDEKMPEKLAGLCKVLNLSQALVNPQAAAVVKELYGVEGELQTLVAMGKTLQELGLQDHHLVGLAQILIEKHQHPEGLSKTFFDFVKAKGGQLQDFLWTQIKSKAITLQDAVSAYAGAKWDQIQAFLEKGLAQSREYSDEILKYLAQSQPGQAVAFVLEQVQRGALGLGDAATRLAVHSQGLAEDLLRQASVKGSQYLDEVISHLENSKAGKAVETLLLWVDQGLLDAKSAYLALQQKGLDLSSEAGQRLKKIAGNLGTKVQQGALQSREKITAISQEIFQKLKSGQISFQAAVSETATRLKGFFKSEAEAVEQLVQICLKQEPSSQIFREAVDFIVSDVKAGGAKKLLKYIAMGALAPVAVPAVLVYLTGKGLVNASRFTKDLLVECLNSGQARGQAAAQEILAYLKGQGTDLVDYLQTLIKEKKLKFETAAEALRNFKQGGAELLQALIAKNKATQWVANSVEQLAKKQQALLKELSTLLNTGGQNSYVALRQLAHRMNGYVDELQKIINSTGLPDQAKAFGQQLLSFYDKVSEASARCSGDVKQVLDTVVAKTQTVLDGIVQKGGSLGNGLKASFEAIKSKFAAKPLQNLSEIERLIQKLHLDQAGADALKKLLGHLGPETFASAARLMENLGAERAKQVLMVLDYVPAFVLKQAFEQNLGHLLVNGVSETVRLTTHYGGKLVGNADVIAKMMGKIAPKIATTVCKAIPAIGVFFSGYDTVRTGKIFYTGTWTDPLSGQTTRYNDETRMMAYLAAGINLVDTALGIAEYFPPAAAVTGAPQIGTAIASLAIDIMIDCCNEGGVYKMPDQAKEALENACYQLAIGTLDYTAYSLISDMAGKRFQRSGEVMADMALAFVQRKKNPVSLADKQQDTYGSRIDSAAELEKFIQTLSWRTADDSTRVFFERLSERGASLEGVMPALTSASRRKLFDHLREVLVRSEAKDYDYMRQLITLSSNDDKEYMLTSLMENNFSALDFMINEQEKMLLYHGINTTDSKNLKDLLDKLAGRNTQSSVKNLAQALRENNLDRQGKYMQVLTKIATTPKTDKYFGQMLLDGDPIRTIWQGLNHNLVEKNQKLGDEERYALFEHFLAESDFEGLETMLFGEAGTCVTGAITNANVRKKMIEALTEQTGSRFLGLFSSSPGNAARLATWVLQYGNTEQFNRVLVKLQDSAWFRDKGAVVRHLIGFARQKDINMTDKLSPQSFTLLTEGLNNVTSKWTSFISDDYQQNLAAMIDLFKMVQSPQQKSQIIQNLMTGWTTSGAETAILEMIKLTGESDQKNKTRTFTTIVNTVGIDRFASEFQNVSQAADFLSTYLQHFGADYRTGTYTQDPSPGFSQFVNAWFYSLAPHQSDNLLALTHSFIKQRGGNGLVHLLSPAARQTATQILENRWLQVRSNVEQVKTFVKNLVFNWSYTPEVLENPYQYLIGWFNSPIPDPDPRRFMR
ncbi:MAG: hypothetical protein AB7I41_17830 [Candidatus Sericytochromatia bacterium]